MVVLKEFNIAKVPTKKMSTFGHFARINTYFADVLAVARFIPSPGAETLVELLAVQFVYEVDKSR